MGARANRRRTCIILVLALSTVAGLSSAQEERSARRTSAHELAAELAALGPRPSGSDAYRVAAERLAARLRALGLAEVEIGGASQQTAPDDRGLVNVSGVLMGEGDREIVLVAHLDTVAGSAGALDDASGCAVVLAAIADLARTPLHHRVRALLVDGEESGQTGSRRWLSSLPAPRREKILAVLAVEMVGWKASDGPVVLTLPRGSEPAGAPVAAGSADGAGVAIPLRRAPGWLVHAALRGAAAVGWELSFLDARRPLAAQLALAVSSSTLAGDADRFLAYGIPAVTLTDLSPSRPFAEHHRPGDRLEVLDGSRLDAWTAATAAIVRRLDRLAGRPIDETEYWVVGGRVWLRRDLYWVGFVVWGALVYHAHRRRKGGLVDPPAALVFRLSVLVALVVAPVVALPLLAPAALLTLVPVRSVAAARALAAAGWLPAAVLALIVGLGVGAGLLAGWRLGAGASALLVVSLAAFTAWTLQRATGQTAR